MLKLCGSERPCTFKDTALLHRLIFSLPALQLFFHSALNWDVQSKSKARTQPFYKLSGQKLNISLCHLMTEQNSLISCAWRSNRLDVTWLSVFCKIFLKLDLLLLTAFWLQSPSTVKFLSLCLEIFPHKTLCQRCSWKWQSFTWCLSSGSSEPSPVKTKPLYYGLFGNFLMLLWATRLCFHSHHLQGQLRAVGTGSSLAPWYLLSPHGAGHSPAVLRDAEHIPVCCYLLLQYTYTQKKSPFIHLKTFHLPRPTLAFTPQLNHQHFIK